MLRDCPTCGAELHTYRGPLTLTFEGVEVFLPEARISECGNCGEKLYPCITLEEASRAKKMKQNRP